MNTTQWLKLNTYRLDGKRVAITGPTGGLGLELCRYAAGLGAALVLLDRNAERSTALQTTLRAEFPAVSLQRIPLDLSDGSSVSAAAAALCADPPDILIHNAGAYSIPRHRTDWALDNVFQINCAAPYYLTRALLPALRERGGHVVAVGSIAHTYSATDPADRDFSTRKAASKVYGNAKRHLMFSLYELFREETAVTLSVVHPGITLTNITAHYPPWLFALIKQPMKVLFPAPRRAALSSVRGLFEPTPYHCWIGPRWCDIWGLPKTKPLRTVSTAESRRIGAEADNWYQGVITHV